MKSNTQNAKIEAITEKTLVLGIDVGSETHYARAFDYRGIEYSKKPFKFSNNEAGFVTFKAWILELKEKHDKDKVVPGMEPTGHYWFNLGKFLQDNEMKPVLVNPHHVKKSKELDDNNPTKNDRKDPKVIAGLVREGRYMIPYLPNGVYADLRTASNMRFQLQAELTRIQNRINRWFSIYFPEYQTVYGQPDAKSGMLILKVAPLPEDILTLGIDGVNQIWRDAKLRAVGKARAKTLVEAAEHSVGSKEGSISARMEIRMLLEDYESRNTRLQEVMTLIGELVKQIPMAEKLLEIKGVGIKTVSGFLAEVGDIGRFNNPKELQKLAGLALVENSSGKQGILEPESYSRFERGKRRVRWAKKKKLLKRLGERGNKVTLLLESDDPDVVEEYQRIMDCSYREKYDLMKEKVYRLEGMLDKKSEINRQFLMHMKNNLDIRFFQVFDSNEIKSKRQKTIVLTVPQYSEVCISKHCWSRTETALIKGIANDYRELGESKRAILILKRGIESFEKEQIGRENTCPGKRLLWEHLATYLGDVEAYEEAILYARKKIKAIIKSGSAKGFSDELYELAWNGKEKGQVKPKLYKKRYLQALNLSILFQEREFIIFLKEREKKYRK